MILVCITNHCVIFEIIFNPNFFICFGFIIKFKDFIFFFILSDETVGHIIDFGSIDPIIILGKISFEFFHPIIFFGR